MRAIAPRGVQTTVFALFLLVTIRLAYTAILPSTWQIDIDRDIKLAHRDEHLPTKHSNNGQISGRADNPPPKYGSLGHPLGQSQGSSNSDSGSESEIDFMEVVNNGALVLGYLSASVEQILADLASKGKLLPVSRLAGRFTEFSAFKQNGHSSGDLTDVLKEDFLAYVPIPNALQDLGLSDKARPEGKN